MVTRLPLLRPDARDSMSSFVAALRTSKRHDFSFFRKGALVGGANYPKTRPFEPCGQVAIAILAEDPALAPPWCRFCRPLEK